MFRKILMLFGLVLMVGFVSAEDINVESCEQEDVQAAIGEADYNDIVIVPVGECTWNNNLTIPDGVKLIGAGSDKTVISSTEYIHVVLGSNSWFEGFNLTNGNALPNYNTGEQGWVIKDNYFGNIGEKQDIGIFSTNADKPSTGVYHGNTLVGCSFAISGKSGGRYAWAQDDNWGGIDEVVYIEDNVFDLDDYGDSSQVLDNALGARIVFRFNEIHNGWIQTHGARENSSTSRRSTRLIEWYGNTFINFDDYRWMSVMYSKGGATMMFNNSCTGHYIRCQFMVGSERMNVGSMHGTCSEENYFDTRPHPLTGGVGCRDVVGMGKDIVPQENSFYSYPNTIPPAQSYSPSYFWNNLHNGSQSSLIEHNADNDLINENIDYFQGDETPDSGVHWGAFADKPDCDSSSEYDAYWATDMGDWNLEGEDGALYQCRDGNWELYYTPAPFPYPLIQGMNFEYPESHEAVDNNEGDDNSSEDSDDELVNNDSNNVPDSEGGKGDKEIPEDDGNVIVENVGSVNSTDSEIESNNESVDGSVGDEEGGYMIWIIFGVVLAVIIILSLVIGLSRSQESI